MGSSQVVLTYQMKNIRLLYLLYGYFHSVEFCCRYVIDIGASSVSSDYSSSESSSDSSSDSLSECLDD